MKRAPRLMFSFLCSALLVFVGGCLEINTTTEVHTDGSLMRTVVISGDSSNIYSGPYTIPLDTTWAREIRKVDSRKFELTATKDFADVEAMNAALRGNEDTTLAIRAGLEKSFQWFFTTYRYSETCKRYNAIQTVPYTDFISAQELESFLRHEVEKEPFASRGDSLALDDASDRFDEWVKRNLFEAFYALFKKGLLSVPGISISPAEVDAREDTVFARAGEYFESGKFYDGKKMERIQRILEKIFGVREAKAGLRAMEPEFDRMKRQLEFQEEVGANTYRVSVIVPGLVTGTNARSLEGNKATWEDFMPYCYLKDYQLWVESRVINWWAVVVTGVVVVALAALLLASSVRRRRTVAVPG